MTKASGLAADREPPRTMSTRLPSLLAVIAALALAACGGDEAGDDTSDERSADNAVEATEQNTVELDGLRYRVNLFRQLNPRISPDRALYDGPAPAEGTGIYAAFLRVCNPGDSRQVPTSEISLEDAFGHEFPRVEAEPDNEFAYEPEPLTPDECLPGPNTAAARTAEGAVLVYEIPVDALGNRPFVLELQAEGSGEVRRIQLDL